MIGKKRSTKGREKPPNREVPPNREIPPNREKPPNREIPPNRGKPTAMRLPKGKKSLSFNHPTMGIGVVNLPKGKKTVEVPFGAVGFFRRLGCVIDGDEVDE